MGPIARALLLQKKPVNQSDSWHQNARISVNIQALEECSSSLESVLDLWLFRPCSLRELKRSEHFNVQETSCRTSGT